MDNFDKLASKILKENLDTFGPSQTLGRMELPWSKGGSVVELRSTDDLKNARIGDAFKFDDVDDLGQHMEVFSDGTDESVVLQFLNQFGEWDFKDNEYGAVVIKTHDLLEDPEY